MPFLGPPRAKFLAAHFTFEPSLRNGYLFIAINKYHLLFLSFFEIVTLRLFRLWVLGKKSKYRIKATLKMNKQTLVKDRGFLLGKP